MRSLLIVAFLLHFFLPAYSQNIDSLSHSIDSSSKALQEISKNYQKLQDSLYKLKMNRSLDQNSRNLDQFLTDMKAQEKREQRQLYIRIGFGVLFFALLIISLVRRRKNAQQNKE